MRNCTKERNMKFCNCTFSCQNKGVCCDCVAYHRAQGQLPACYFPADAEKTADRSIDNFIRVVQDRGTGFLR